MRLLPRYRPDDDIQADILKEMRLESLLFPQDVLALRADVTAGVVRVRGNVHTSRTHRDLVDKARRVAGVLSVTDELVEDQELEMAVAAALARDPATRSLNICVFPRAGEIELAGKAPDEEVAELAIETAASVPGVRSVTSSLTWPGLGQPAHVREFGR
jgi:osmotically-inducible protein OsmY